MRIRFLQPTPSSTPSYPFQTGQIIDVPRLSPELRQWIRDGRAELIEPPNEAAALGHATETAVAGSAKRRGAR